MPQPVAFNTGSAISGSIQTSKISYAVDGDNKDYRGGYAGKTWYSELPATNGVVFAKDTTSIGRGISGSMAFWTSATTSSTDILFTANRLPGPFHYFSDTGSAYSWSFNNGYFINDPNEPLTNTISDGLILYLDAAKMQSMQAGVPTTNLLFSSSMPPLNSGSAVSTTNPVADYNVGSCGWNWGVYPSTNVSPEGGMDWLPNEPDPLGGVGVWKMKKRPGGNSESNWEGRAVPISISSTLSYTISVYCRTTVAGMARIHINTTRNGASYWGFASANHTGDGTWQRLSVTIPANDGNTSINVVRCQAYGTNINAEIYWKYYQVEANSTATPYITGSRAVWLDMSGNNYSASLINGVSFNSNQSFQLDNVDDQILFNNINFDTLASSSNFTAIFLCKKEFYGSGGNLVGNSTLFQGSNNGYNNGWRITEGSTGTPGNPFSGVHTIAANFPAVSWNMYMTDSYNVYRPAFVAVSVGPTTSIGFCNEGKTTVSTGTYITGSNYGRISFTGAGVGAWGGKIYSSQFYNRALSLSEIRQLYYGGPIVTNGLILGIDASNVVSYESGSTNTYSLTGSLSGSLINGTAYSVDKGGSWLFDNTDDYIALPNDLGYSTTTLSVFSWFKSNGRPSGDYHIICGGQQLEISIPWPGGALRTGIQTDTRYVSNHGSGLNDGKWHYIGFTFDGVTKTSYIDGVNVGTQTITSGTLVTSFSSRFLGRFGSSTVYYANGNMGGYWVYNKALTEAEVSQNFNAQRQRFGI
jgi:hypothetical protein